MKIYYIIDSKLLFIEYERQYASDLSLWKYYESMIIYIKWVKSINIEDQQGHNLFLKMKEQVILYFFPEKNFFLKLYHYNYFLTDSIYSHNKMTNLNIDLYL